MSHCFLLKLDGKVFWVFFFFDKLCSYEQKICHRICNIETSYEDEHRGFCSDLNQRYQARTWVIPYILYYKVYNPGRTQSDRPCSLDHTSMQEHGSLHTSHKMCLQIINATFICSGIDA